MRCAFRKEKVIGFREEEYDVISQSQSNGGVGGGIYWVYFELRGDL